MVIGVPASEYPQGPNGVEKFAFGSCFFVSRRPTAPTRSNCLALQRPPHPKMGPEWKPRTLSRYSRTRVVSRYLCGLIFYSRGAQLYFRQLANGSGQADDSVALVRRFEPCGQTLWHILMQTFACY